MDSSTPVMTSSILMDVRAACSVEPEDNGFDSQLIPLINSQLMVAHQIGVAPNGFVISDASTTWQDMLGDNAAQLAAIKTWLGYSVLLLFDPPDNGTVLKSYQDQVQKLEWMLCNKSLLEHHVSSYVPEHAGFYEGVYQDMDVD